MEKLSDLLKGYMPKLRKRNEGLLARFDIHIWKRKYSFVDYQKVMSKDEREIKQWAEKEWKKMMEKNSPRTRKLLESGCFDNIPFEYKIVRSEEGFGQYVNPATNKKYERKLRYNYMTQSFERKENGNWIKLELKPTLEDIRALQVKVYTLIEDPLYGWLGMVNPANFYLGLDSDTHYTYEKIKEIYLNVSLLEAISFPFCHLGYSPDNIPDPGYFILD